MKLAVVISRYHAQVAEGLLKGAFQVLGEQGIGRAGVVVLEAPGAFEIPLIAQEAARSGKFGGVICLGCVIQGETEHFKFICESTVQGLMSAALTTRVPITFGILTTLNEEQAWVRSGGGFENKGREAALACIGAIKALAQIAGN